MNILTAFYDLAHSPPTYDMVTFVCLAEHVRIEQELDGINFVFVLGPIDGFRDDVLPPRDPMVRQQMLDNICKPLCTLLPSCINVSVMKREEANAVEGKTFGLDQNKYAMTYTALLWNKGFLPLRTHSSDEWSNVITITLRETEYWPGRNSDLNVWREIATWLQDQGEEVIFIRDTNKAYTTLDGFTISPKHSKDLLARATLYNSAKLNLFIPNGPQAIAINMNAPTLLFRKFDKTAPCIDLDFYTKSGWPVNSQIPNSNVTFTWRFEAVKPIKDAITKWREIHV